VLMGGAELNRKRTGNNDASAYECSERRKGKSGFNAGCFSATLGGNVVWEKVLGNLSLEAMV